MLFSLWETALRVLGGLAEGSMCPEGGAVRGQLAWPQGKTLVLERNYSTSNLDPGDRRYWAVSLLLLGQIYEPWWKPGATPAPTGVIWETDPKCSSRPGITPCDSQIPRLTVHYKGSGCCAVEVCNARGLQGYTGWYCGILCCWVYNESQVNAENISLSDVWCPGSDFSSWNE